MCSEFGFVDIVEQQPQKPMTGMRKRYRGQYDDCFAAGTYKYQTRCRGPLFFDRCPSCSCSLQFRATRATTKSKRGHRITSKMSMAELDKSAMA